MTDYRGGVRTDGRSVWIEESLGSAVFPALAATEK